MAKIHSPRFLQLAQAARNNVKEITARDLQPVAEPLEGAPKILLIDVREDHEWAQGHLPEAHHLGRGILERDIEKLVPNPDTPLVLYCGGGFRSALAAESLAKMGYTNVKSLAGGYTGWVEAGFTIVTPAKDIS